MGKLCLGFRYLAGSGWEILLQAAFPEGRKKVGSKKMHSEITVFVISCASTDGGGRSVPPRSMSPGVKRPNEMSIHAASAASSVCGFIPRDLRLYRLDVNLALGESSAGRGRTYDGRMLIGSQVRRSNSAQRSP